MIVLLIVLVLSGLICFTDEADPVLILRLLLHLHACFGRFCLLVHGRFYLVRLSNESDPVSAFPVLLVGSLINGCSSCLL